MKYRIEVQFRSDKWITATALREDKKLVPSIKSGCPLNGLTRCQANKLLKYIQSVEQTALADTYRMVEDT